jgi:tripartite ATP-independent transporter DctM subunit
MCVSAVASWLVITALGYRGADLVVLAICLTIAFAFTAAVLNLATEKWLKLRFLSRLTQQTTFAMVPPLALIFLVLGTIFIGVATPTEGGAMGAAGAVMLALARRRLSLDLLRQAMQSTARLCVFVIFILIGARVFSLAFYGLDGHLWVEELLLQLPGGQLGFLIAVNILVFFLAFFLDFFEIAFIVVPLLAPAAERLGIDLVWFGVLLGVNMQTSFMHPPFGFALFYLRSVAPAVAYVDPVSGRSIAPVRSSDIYWGAVPFLLIQAAMVALLIAFPQITGRHMAPMGMADPSEIHIDIQTPDQALPLNLR